MIANLLFSKKFRKHYKKRIIHDVALDRRSRNRIDLFVNNSSHPLLRDHSLKGSQEGSRAFWVTGDVRIVYQRIDNNTVEFLDIGAHNQVYR